MAGKTNKLNSASKRRTFIDNDDSDSDSSSNESFLAVPEQFRPRKSPVPKEPISESILTENKVSNIPNRSKPISCSEQPPKILTQKTTVSDSSKASSKEYEKSYSGGKLRLPESTLILKGKKLSEETEKTRNKLTLEVTDEPIKCRNTRRNLKMSENADKPRAPVHQNRQNSRNASLLSLEVEEIAPSGKNENEIIENKGKGDHISLTKSGINVIELDVANIPPVNETKRSSKIKQKCDNLPEKADHNYPVNTKRNPVSYKYTKNRRFQPKQVSYSIQKQECIRWNSTLNLNTLDEDLHNFTPKMVDKICQKSSDKKIEWSVVGEEKSPDNKIEWTVVREERTFISARKLEASKMNNSCQIAKEKTDSKIQFKVTAKSNETNFHTLTNGIERPEPKSIPKATVMQNARDGGGKKTHNTQINFYKNNLKQKNVLMDIQARKESDSGNSKKCEKPCNDVEYDCCKKYMTCDENELKEENHCYLCEISKPSNEANRSHKGQTHDQLKDVNLPEENQHYRGILSNNQHSSPLTRKTKPVSVWFSDINDYEKSENLRKPCQKKNYDCCERHVTFDEVVSSEESFYHEGEKPRPSKNTNICRQQPKSVNSVQENVRQKNLDNDNQESVTQQGKSNDVKSDDSKVSEENQNSVLQFGREISDLVIGCHMALSTFFSIYNQWSRSRRELIEQFEQLEENIRDSSKKYAKYSDVLKVVGAGATMASAIPNPYVSVAAKIVTIISSLISKFINTSKSDATDVEEPEITTSLFRDIDLSAQLYMHGLQCNHQFEETTKFIEEFLSGTSICEFCAPEDTAMRNFIRGVVEYTPKHHVFYKKLHKCFQELIQKCSSSFSRRFCEPFQLYGLEAVDVIGYLDWRFTQEFSNESVRHELEELTRLMQSKSTSMKDLLLEIKNCIVILRDEVCHVERCVDKVSMFDSSFENLKLNSK